MHYHDVPMATCVTTPHLKRSGTGSASSLNTIYQIQITLRLWIRESFMPSVRDNLFIVPMMEWAVMKVSPSSRALPSLEMLYLTALSRKMNLEGFPSFHSYQRQISETNKGLTSASNMSSSRLSVARNHRPL